LSFVTHFVHCNTQFVACFSNQLRNVFRTCSRL